MRTFHDAKAMAKTLRQGLKQRQIELSHGDCLELIATAFGFHDWNTLSAGTGAPVGEDLRLPQGWTRTGSAPEQYEMGIDPKRPGSPVAIRYTALAAPAKGFGCLMQSIRADAYRRRVLRFAAELKAMEVSGAGAIWMRVQRQRRDILRFDNLEARSVNGALHGSVDWAEREIVLDIPGDADSIHFGFYLRGTGTVCLRHATIAEADPGTAVTAGLPSYPDRPLNLGFSLG